MADALGLPGGPAFPVSIPGVGDNGCAGMSLRDWFAGQVIAEITRARFAVPSDIMQNPVSDDIACICYEIADAMLKERNK